MENARETLPLLRSGFKFADLHSVTSDTTIDAPRFWCGPSAVSALTGQPQEHVSQWIAKRRGKGTARGVRGTSTGEVRSALAHTGLHTKRLESYEKGDRPTLAAWLKQRGPEVRKATCLIEVGDHWIVVKGRKLVDNHHPTPVFIKQAKGRRARVKKVWLVYREKNKKLLPVLRAA